MGSSARLQASFVSAGGYHHHVGLNSWIGHGRPPAPEGSQGLRHYTVVLPDDAGFEAVAERIRAANVTAEKRPDGLFLRDPSQNGILITQARRG